MAGGGTVDLGQRVVLTPFVSGSDSTVGFSYQWKKNGTDVIGATGSSYTIVEATASDTGAYAVPVTNAAGTSVASGESCAGVPGD